MKKFKQWQNQRFQKGSNRFVILLNNKVIKIPIGLIGISANQIEFKNSLIYPSLIAKTTLFCKCIIIQEKLQNIQIFNRYEVKENIPQYLHPLFDIKVHNRLQVGQSKNGQWKIFDYEDIKYYKEKEKH